VHPEFNESYERARDIRASAAFTEQQLQIADNTSDDWSFNRESGKLTVNKDYDSVPGHVRRSEIDSWSRLGAMRVIA
jgi:hypothetical protein